MHQNKIFVSVKQVILKNMDANNARIAANFATQWNSVPPVIFK